MTQNKNIKDFWDWFREIAALLSRDVENPLLLQEVDARVHRLDSTLSWEIGPGSHEPWQFVISPNLDRQLRTKAQEIVSQAPVMHGWEFHSARRPKEWDYKLLMERSEGQPPLRLDTSGWGFVVLRYPDGSQEILLQANDLPALSDDERWQAAAITLESILGEDVLLDKVSEFELVEQLESRFAEKRKPIQDLRAVLLTI